jgi:hypothetical protein
MQSLVVVRVKNIQLSTGTNFAIRDLMKETGKMFAIARHDKNLKGA